MMENNVEKMVDSKDRVEDRVETYPDSKVEVPQEFYGDMEDLKSDLAELDKARREVGRLTQQVNNIITFCNNLENRAREKRQELSKKVGLTEGRWAVDFEKRAFFKIVPGAPNVV
jgi:hypothetical protein